MCKQRCGETDDRETHTTEYYLSTSPFRGMSTAEFIEWYFGIKPSLYQRLYLFISDKKDSFQKRYMPFRYYTRMVKYGQMIDSAKEIYCDNCKWCEKCSGARICTNDKSEMQFAVVGGCIGCKNFQQKSFFTKNAGILQE